VCNENRILVPFTENPLTEPLISSFAFEHDGFQIPAIQARGVGRLDTREADKLKADPYMGVVISSHQPNLSDGQIDSVFKTSQYIGVVGIVEVNQPANSVLLEGNQSINRYLNR